MFQNIFGKAKANEPTTLSTAKLLNDYVNVFSQYDGNAWQDSTIRNCVDVIARNVAKTKANHIRRVNNKLQKTDSQLDYFLSTRPNPYTSAYDFVYKQICQLLIYNNAFVYVQTDVQGNVTGLYNIDFQQIELKETNDNQLYCKFYFQNNNVVVPYSDMIHLRRNYFNNEIFGSDNRLLQEPVQILKSIKQSLQNAVVNSTKLRGYLKAPVVVADSDDKDNILQRFISTFTGKNKYGIAVLDQSTDYVSLTNDLETVDKDQLNYCREDIYRFWGVNSKIIEGNFTEEDYVSFYESTIEPILIQMGQEYTYKIFTMREQSFGNEIIFSSNRLEYSSLKNKVSLVHELIPTGILTGNEVRSIFGFDERDDLDERLVSLNYVKSSDMTKYQTGQDDEQTEGEQNDGTAETETEETDGTEDDN
jgi:HK97 family phage portal protein